MKTSLPLHCVLLAAIAGTSSAAVLVDYKMTPSGGLPTDPATGAAHSSGAGVTATGLVNQAGVFTTASDNYNGGTDRVSIWNTAAGSATSYANAFAAGSYVTFQLTANAGYTVNFSSITLQAAAATTGPSDRAFYLVASATNTFSAASAVLGTDRTLAGGGAIPYQAASSINTVPKDYSFDLSSLAGLASGETIYFRFYLQTPNAGQGIAFDDIVVNGTASAIPEPSSFAATAGGALLLGAATRRRRRD